jgi:hypothetical protein
MAKAQPERLEEPQPTEPEPEAPKPRRRVYAASLQAFEALPARYHLPVLRAFADQLADASNDAARRQAIARAAAKAMAEAIRQAQEDDDEEIFLLVA